MEDAEQPIAPLNYPVPLGNIWVHPGCGNALAQGRRGLEEMMKLYYRLIGYRYKFKDWFFENITPKLPKIPTRKPDFPGMSDVCKRCKTEINIYAYHTGDGWCFFWDCEEQHISDKYYDDFLVGWFPFLFGWATGKDLERIGIEVV